MPASVSSSGKPPVESVHSGSEMAATRVCWLAAECRASAVGTDVMISGRPRSEDSSQFV